eukprot:CAMPEP_0173468800 /NCGR_PEP_ID=MMETSP1357-20121228/77035_1 /TAXON_ID=77926 /ORGANISM="Hemiselmis rufescens, Strain PCC563" /LENGTH=386 /DNA_ID=CAMNT_0014437023 /DNA_START=227 /DNA_END=1385 /DNA_ORIENTATION=+
MLQLALCSRASATQVTCTASSAASSETAAQPAQEEAGPNSRSAPPQSPVLGAPRHIDPPQSCDRRQEAASSTEVSTSQDSHTTLGSARLSSSDSQTTCGGSFTSSPAASPPLAHPQQDNYSPSVEPASSPSLPASPVILFQGVRAQQQQEVSGSQHETDRSQSRNPSSAEDSSQQSMSSSEGGSSQSSSASSLSTSSSSSQGSSQSSSASSLSIPSSSSQGSSQSSSASSLGTLSSSNAALAEALQATNLLNITRDVSWLRKWDKKMVKGLPRHSRDCMDMAGKLPLALKALDTGISPQELLVDCAQAGGLHGRGNGSLVASDGCAEGIEIKGAGLKRGKRCSFAFKGIRVRGTDWKHLFLLGREREPEGWSSASDVDGCMWLGYV